MSARGVGALLAGRRLRVLRGVVGLGIVLVSFYLLFLLMLVGCEP